MKNKLLTEEEKKNRSLTLKDISPEWASRLEQTPSLVSLNCLKWYFEIAHSSKCVVGEAYGFSSYYIYTCKDCGEIGFKFMLFFIINSHKKLEENKRRFVEHWNEKHAG